jgi:hypothetical protein
LFRFIGDESEIILDGNEKERAEFSEWKWASTEEVLDKVLCQSNKQDIFSQLPLDTIDIICYNL